MRLTICLLLPAVALGQVSTNTKMVTFNRADTEHCKVVAASGKPLLESTFNGTSVAIALPVNRGNGEFAVFVAISRADAGTIEVNPKDFYGLYSDEAHTRFEFYDKSAETAGPGSGMNAEAAQVDPGSLRPGAVLGGAPPGGGSIGSEPPPGSKNPASGPAAPSTYFHHGKIKQGDKLLGWIVLRQAKGSKLAINPSDMLAEIDIQVGDTIFRF